MKYKCFSKSGLEISKAVLGVLQLPEAADPTSVKHEPRADAIRYAIDNGANYLNLGHPYYFAEPDKACASVRSILSDGYREKVQLAVNIPAAKVSSMEDMDRYLEEQLAWFDLESVEVCIISGIYRGNWAKLKNAGLARWLDKVTAEGKIKYAGYSFHDDPHIITPIQRYYDKWAVIQVDYSFMDERHHPGGGGIVVAAANYGMCVIASQCMKGGRLINNLPEKVGSVWANAPFCREAYEWAIRWVYNNENVAAAQFEPGNWEEARLWLSCADACEADSMGLDELLIYRKVVEAYEERQYFSCPACRCCMPCTVGVDAPRIGELYNEICMYGDMKIPLFKYRLENDGAPECINCGRCVKLCPRKNDLPGAFFKMKELAGV